MNRFSRWRAFAIPLALGLLLAHAARATGAGGGGHDTLLPVLEALVLVLIAARLGGALFARLGMPAVLGELLAGVALSALGNAGLHVFQGADTAVVLDTLAQLGVLFLLFSVGLESDVARLAAVGPSALLVAVVGVVAPMLLGVGVSAWMHPGQAGLAHAFVGATLAATSVGITARVLADLGRAASLEGRIILGAAVLDDVLGLLVLAAVSGVISAAEAGTAFSAASLLVIAGKAVGFLVLAVFVGRWVSKQAFAFAGRLRGEGLLLTLAVAFCFTLSWLAGLAGLAPIVGAFAAGLVLDEVHYRVLLEREPHVERIEQLLGPISQFLVPVFFVLMGMAVDVTAFARPEVLVFAAVLTVAAIAGKQACALAVLDPRADRLAIGLGMIPRGEVGLIFASIGRTLRLHGEPVIDGSTYSAVVVMVVLTTLVTPPLLAARLKRLPPPRVADGPAP
ncbi:MAG: cation:proton antiporter [Candidatus Eisenbacteria bacterium]|nr:cation:proton antiporter [Candidatus Eisenbacteria bacterium]